MGMRFSRPGRPGISAGILACIFIAAVSISGSGCSKMAEEVLQTLPGRKIMQRKVRETEAGQR